MPETISQTIEIPLDQILLNDNNLRDGINQDYVATLSVSMAVDGQKNAIKVRRLPAVEIANLPLNLTIPKGVDIYRNVGGDHRYLAARKLGWATIKAIVLDVTAQEAVLEGHLDNQGQPKTWFANYRAIEATAVVYPKMTQQAIADKVMTTRVQVNQAQQDTTLPQCRCPGGNL